MPDRATSSLLSSLTPRERDILRLMAEDLSGSEMAERLVVSPQTIKWYIKEIYSKLGVHTRDEALALVDPSSLTDGADAAPARHNMPAPVTSLVGRARELTALRARLRDPAVRLVTLIGPPGIGKTRLSIELAQRMTSEFSDGVAFVALAPLSDPALVADAIALALGLDADGRAPAVERIRFLLKTRRVLLVLDNFEHLLPAAPLVGELLSAAPGVKMLATSREPLRVYGEHEYTVSPLDPATDAVTLFAERAQAVRPDFALTGQNVVTVTAICKRLEGLPLAIELAAARMRMYTPHALLGRLASRLNVLTGGARDVSPRHQTLRAAIAWSYDLLTADEQRMMARFSVFDGGASLEAFAAVCGEGLDLDPYAGLESLVGKSLIQQTTGADGEPRFTMYEALIEFAAERLAANGEEEAVRVAHASYFLTLAAAYGDSFRTPNEQLGLRGFEIEYANIRAAWLFAAERPGDELLGPAARNWVRLYTQVGRARDGAFLYETALRPRQDDETLLSAHLMAGHAIVCGLLGDEDTAWQWTNRALELFERFDDAEGQVKAIITLCFDQRIWTNPDESEPLYRRALDIAERHGLSAYIDSLLMDLALVEYGRGQIERCREMMEAHLADVRQRGIRSAEVWLCSNLVHVELAFDDLDGAQLHAEAGLDAARALGMRRKVGDLCGQLAMLAFVKGDLERADDLQTQALEHDAYAGVERTIREDQALMAAIDARRGRLDDARAHWAQAIQDFSSRDVEQDFAEAILGLIAPGLFVALALGQPERAAEMAGLVCSHPQTNPWITHLAEISRPELAAQLGEEAFDAAWARGAAWSLDELLAAARRI